MTKPTKWVCAQRRLRSAWASAQSDQSLRCAPNWVAKDPRFLHADSEDTDQTGRMPRLIWVFAGRTLSLLVFTCRGSHNWSSCKIQDFWCERSQRNIRFEFRLLIEYIRWKRSFTVQQAKRKYTKNSINAPGTLKLKTEYSKTLLPNIWISSGISAVFSY